MKSYPIAMAGRGALAALAALEIGRIASERGEAIVTVAEDHGDRVSIIDEITTLPSAYWGNPPSFFDMPSLRARGERGKWRGYQPRATPDPEKDRRKRKAAGRARAITKRNRK